MSLKIQRAKWCKCVTCKRGYLMTFVIAALTGIGEIIQFSNKQGGESAENQGEFEPQNKGISLSAQTQTVE